MNLRQKLILVISIISFCILFNGLVGYFGCVQIIKQLNLVIEKTAPELILLGKVSEISNRMQAEAIGIVLLKISSVNSKDISNKEIIDAVNEEQEELDKTIQQLIYFVNKLDKHLSSKNSVLWNIDKLKKIALTFKFACINLSDAALKDKIDNSKIVYLKEKLELAEEDLEELISNVIEIEKKELTTNKILSNAISDNTILAVIIFSIFIFLLSFVSGIFIIGKITRPIIELRNNAQQIGNGNLKIEIDNNYSGEIGELATSFKHMLREINKRIEIEKKYTESRGLAEVEKKKSEELKNAYEKQKLIAEKLKEKNKDLIDANEEIMRKEQILFKLNKELEEVIFTDTLTGAINRSPFLSLLNTRIINAKMSNEKFAVLYLDIDDFKRVNEIYGHSFGDNVLIHIAESLKNIFHGIGLVGRLGGDEFLICVNNVNYLDDISAIIMRTVESLNGKITIDNKVIDISTSTGVAIYPDDGKNVNHLIKASNIAMQKAKVSNVDKYQFFNLDFKKEQDIEYALLKALDNNEFYLNYQPIVNSTGTCKFIEALLRWDNPKFKNISPAYFVPILEKNKMISKVGQWVFQEAYKKIEKINRCNKNFENIIASINISEVQLEDQSFLKELRKVYEKFKDSKKFLFEITEGQRIDQIKNINKTLGILKSEFSGFIAIDDYGSGYSSFENLINFPVDIVKLDMSITRRINSERYSKTVEGIILALQKLELKVVAEGVETEEQFCKLREIGCNYFQGYYFSKPVSNILEVLEANNGIFHSS